MRIQTFLFTFICLFSLLNSQLIPDPTNPLVISPSLHSSNDDNSGSNIIAKFSIASTFNGISYGEYLTLTFDSTINTHFSNNFSCNISAFDTDTSTTTTQVETHYRFDNDRGKHYEATHA